MALLGYLFFSGLTAAWFQTLNPPSSRLRAAGVYREATTTFTVDARPLSRQGGDHVTVDIRNPSGALTDCSVIDKADGTYAVEYTPFENGNTAAHHSYDPVIKD